MKNKLLISLVLFSLTLYSCGPDKIPLNEYMAHIENVENGLKVSFFFFYNKFNVFRRFYLHIIDRIDRFEF